MQLLQRLYKIRFCLISFNQWAKHLRYIYLLFYNLYIHLLTSKAFESQLYKYYQRRLRPIDAKTQYNFHIFPVY